MSEPLTALTLAGLVLLLEEHDARSTLRSNREVQAIEAARKWIRSVEAPFNIGIGMPELFDEARAALCDACKEATGDLREAPGRPAAWLCDACYLTARR